MSDANATRRAGRLGAIALALWTLPSLAAAQDETAEPGIEAILASLDDPRFSERERASVTLEIRAEELEAIIEDGLDLSGLSLEQVERIARSLRARFWVTPRAALGVRFGQQVNAMTEGLLLQEVLAGFPSAGALRGGDIVLIADGVSLVDMPGDLGQQLMRASILSRDPGETLPMLVRRGNIELRVDVPLGAYRDLQGVAPLSDDELTRAWAVRSDRLGLTRFSGGVIESNVARRDWPQQRQRVIALADTIATGGGTGHSADFGESMAIAQGERVEALRDEQIKQVREELQTQVSMLTMQLQVVEREAANPTATENERRRAAQLYMQIESRIAELQRQIDQLDGRR